MKSSVTRALIRILFGFILLLFGISLSIAQGGRSDSVVTVDVGPGVKHMTIFREGPLTINVLVIDLADTTLRLESYRPNGLATTSRQARQNDRPGHRVVAAVNADFFSKEGWPVNNQVENGEFVFGTQTQRSHLVVDNQGRIRIERVSFNGWIESRNGKIYPVISVNDVHRSNAIVLHTSFSDSSTDFPGAGSRFLLKRVDRAWAVGDTLRMVVSKGGPVDLTNIPLDEAALWIGREPPAAELGRTLNIGDTVIVCLGIVPAVTNVRTILGGIGRIIVDGRPVGDRINVTEKTNVAFLRARHPRTFVGFDRDTTKFFIFTVDGRQPKSIGMSFEEMADFLISIGAWNAVNFDGGGSTTMVVSGKIVNSPSDKTGERPVANTLQVVRISRVQ